MSARPKRHGSLPRSRLPQVKRRDPVGLLPDLPPLKLLRFANPRAAFNDTRPWASEPDYVMFEASGLTCMVRRVPELGHLCGYVGVGRTHPLFEVDRTDLVPAPDTWTERPFDIDEHGAIDTFIALGHMHADEIPEGFAPLNMLIGVHGGLTWSARVHDHTGWWFGFDCAHFDDFSPGLAETIERAGRDASFLREFGTYRTLDYVKHECATLAQQIADWSERIGHVDAARELIARLREVRREAGDEGDD